jgi:hypothetical protein
MCLICNNCGKKINFNKKEKEKLERLIAMKEKLESDPMCGCDRFGSGYLEQLEKEIEELEKLNSCEKCQKKELKEKH